MPKIVVSLSRKAGIVAIRKASTPATTHGAVAHQSTFGARPRPNRHQASTPSSRTSHGEARNGSAAKPNAVIARLESTAPAGSAKIGHTRASGAGVRRAAAASPPTKNSSVPATAPRPM